MPNNAVPHYVFYSVDVHKLVDDMGAPITVLDLSSITTFTSPNGGVTRANLSDPASRKGISVNGAASIATTSTTDMYVIVQEAGSLASVDFSSLAALAANDTNYITFSITNLGQDGSGSAAMLAATAVNTTQVTGGSALVANTKRSLTLNATPANLVVAAGDRLLIRATATGTLAGAVTIPTWMLRFSGTT